MQKLTYKLVLPALCAALIGVTTLLIQIPIPGSSGYANLGDGVLLTCAFICNPAQAAVAAAIGSTLADLLSGYIAYAPGTFLIKGGMALIAAQLSQGYLNRFSSQTVARGLSGILAELTMTAGYFLYDAIILSYGMGALASIPGNLIQGSIGLVVSITLSQMLPQQRR